MRSKSACPDGPTLQRFLLGQTPEDASAILEHHLEQCAACSAALETLQASDSVVDAIRAQLGAAGDAGTVAVRQLTDRLKEFRPADCLRARALERDATLPHALNANAASRTDAQPESDATESDAGRARTDGRYDFLAPAEHPHELGRLGHYQVRKVLGAGGMGVVFEAYDCQLDRLVALKAMLPVLATRTSAKQRFLREAKAVAALKHDHIVTIYQVGEDRGTPFLAMELLEGESLSDKLRREGRLPVPEMLRIARETAQALAAAHKRNLIHRDVKPGNIFLETKLLPPAVSDAPLGLARDYRVKLLDFGLARPATDDGQLTQVGAIVGTPAFMAPEQFRGQPVDFRCDLFSLGCVLYQMATGEQPFKGADAIATLLAVTTEEARPPQEINADLPPALCELVMRLLAKNPDERPRSAVAVIEAIEAIESGQSLLPQGDRAAVPAGRVFPAHKTVGRPLSRRTRMAAASVILLGVLGLGAYLFGPTIVRIICNEGELIVEINDPQVQAIIGQTSVTIRDQAKNKEYKIKPGPQPVAAGAYLLEVTEVGGDMRLFTKEFTIARGGNATVRVTFDPKVLTAKTVWGHGKAPTELYADPAHSLKDVVDFRDIAGASAKEFSDWQLGLGPEFRLSLVNTHKGSGSTRFNAVAVREKTPHMVRCLPELLGDENLDRIWNRLVDDNGYRSLALCRSQAPNDKAPWAQTQLLVRDHLPFRSWYGSLQRVTSQVAKESAEGYRLTYLEAFWGRAGAVYDSILVADQTRAWKPFYTLSPEELVVTIKSHEEKAWRPDVVAPDWDGRHLRFMLVMVDNRDGADWRFRMDMTHQQYQTESAKQKELGLFPLALASYGDDAKAHYTAIWVRYRAPGDPAPKPAQPDPKAQVDRAAKAVSWTSAAEPKKFFADQAHALAEVLDYRDIAGVDLKEFRAWVDALGPDFQVSDFSNRRGSGATLFNAVAVREQNPHEYRFFPELSNEEADATWKGQIGFRAVAVRSYQKPDQKTGWTDAVLFVKDGVGCYNWHGSLEVVRETAAKVKPDGSRVTYLDAYSNPPGSGFRSVLPDDQGRKWDVFYAVSSEELLPTVEFYQRRGWRPDVLAPYWDGAQLRFMLVAVDNSDQVDWRFRMDMSLAEYQKEAVLQKQQGLFPLTLASYGNEADVRYAAIFVRFRDAAKK